MAKDKTIDSNKIHNVNIATADPLLSPAEIKKLLPLPTELKKVVSDGRQTIQNILDRTDRRLIGIIGPCSVHDTDCAYEYATRLKNLAQKVQDSIVIVMRVYFEKPRTVTGWKGLINDPFMDDSFRINEGFKIARKLLIDVTSLGIPAATETLDPIGPQYIDDLVSWSAIGARTTESQTHRELASGLSTPVGFKNSTNGSIQPAIYALLAASKSHHFLGINADGKCCVFQTKGNQYGHIVLRGGETPNYHQQDIENIEQQLEAHKLPKNCIVDCSHGNSLKRPELQTEVLANIVEQIKNGNQSIVGFMLESNLSWGNQQIPKDLQDLRYGVSVTDACIDWKTTEETVISAHEQLVDILPSR